MTIYSAVLIQEFSQYSAISSLVIYSPVLIQEFSQYSTIFNLIWFNTPVACWFATQFFKRSHNTCTRQFSIKFDLIVFPNTIWVNTPQCSIHNAVWFERSHSTIFNIFSCCWVQKSARTLTIVHDRFCFFLRLKLFDRGNLVLAFGLLHFRRDTTQG